MKRILYTVLTAAAILFGNFFFSNGTLEAKVETPETAASAIIPALPVSLEGNCPTPTSDKKLLMNTDGGYCFLYPAEYSTSLPGNIIINPVSTPGGDMPGDAWMSMNKEPAANQTAAQIADQQIASVGTGFNISRMEIMVDGKQAVVIDGLPGQDSTRKVLIVNNGRIYTFTFTPWYPNAAEPTPLEHLYTMVTETLRFPPSNTSTVFAGTGVSFMGTSFTLPEGLASGTRNESLPPTPDYVVSPAHIRIVLQDYPLQGKAFEPQILIFPAVEFAQMDQDVAKQRIERLQIILNTLSFSPQPVPDIFQTNRPQEELPFLPNQHAGQVLHAQEKFLSFKNGTGIRYITQLSQAAFPLINNMDAFYTFQGLTSDGQYYVSVIMPVNLPYLAADYGPDAFINPTEVQNPDKYPGYLQSMLEKLNQPEDEGINPYAPSLAALDTLVESLLTGAPESSNATPSDSTVEPVASVNMDGMWTTNVSKLTLKQTGPEITGTMEGYGDIRGQDLLQGSWTGNTATLNSQLLGDLDLVFSGDTFRTIPGSRVSFCGIRAGVSEELPAGCGFSGTWHLSSGNFFPAGSTVILKQTADKVSGEFYDGKGNVFDKLDGRVILGKGWHMEGRNEKDHAITLVMNSFETGFEYIYDDLYQLQLCAARDGSSSADLGNFICTP